MARYVWSTEANALVEVGSDWTDAERRAETPTEGLTYSNLRAPDGTVIDSKRKHREYMERNGLSLASDFSETWAKAQKERDAYRSGQKVNPEMRFQLGKLEYEASKKRRR